MLTLHCIALHCFALLCIGLHCCALLCIALHCFALLCIALHCFALLCIALHCFALLCIPQRSPRNRGMLEEPELGCNPKGNYSAFLNIPWGTSTFLEEWGMKSRGSNPTGNYSGNRKVPQGTRNGNPGERNPQATDPLQTSKNPIKAKPYWGTGKLRMTRELLYRVPW